MSMRTIVEFNHDYAHRISENGPEFLTLLRYAMNSGGAVEWEKLERYGVRRAVMVHHSSDRKVVVGDSEFQLP